MDGGFHPLPSEWARRLEPPQVAHIRQTVFPTADQATTSLVNPKGNLIGPRKGGPENRIDRSPCSA
mgnify:CR=1 FL=1